MATKNQHYVPRVYIKSWETTVYSKKEPQKAFTGVYYYDNIPLIYLKKKRAKVRGVSETF